MKITVKQLRALISECLIESSRKFRTLYYIGRRPASPKPKTRYVDYDGTEWNREWLRDPVLSGVFLTPNPVDVGQFHGLMWGNVYAYCVPEWVIKSAGGLHKFEHATEILIPAELWKHVKFLGKSIDSTEFEKLVRVEVMKRRVSR